MAWLNSSNWAIDGILTGTVTLGQSGPESNGNEVALHIPQTLRQEPHHQMQFSVIIRNIFRIMSLTMDGGNWKIRIKLTYIFLMKNRINIKYNWLVASYLGFMAYQALKVI